MLIDRKHTPWAVVTLLLSAVAWLAYTLDPQAAEIGKHTGSTWIGLGFGIAAYAIMIFCVMLALKRKAPHWKLGRAQTWLRGHIWLGLFCVLLVGLHSAFALGGPMTTAIWIVLGLVVASAIFGLILQQTMPRLLLHSVPGETVAQQLEKQFQNIREMAEGVVTKATAPPPPPKAAPKPAAAPGSAPPAAGPAPSTPLVPVQAASGVAPVPVSAPASAVASAPAASPLPPTTSSPPASAAPPATAPAAIATPAAPASPPPPPEGSDQLRNFFESKVKPYLDGAPNDLRLKGRAEAVFQSARAAVPQAMEQPLEDLEGLCDRFRNYRRQRKLMVVLHSWLVVHIPLSWGLLILVGLHAVYALRFVGEF